MNRIKNTFLAAAAAVMLIGGAAVTTATAAPVGDEVTTSQRTANKIRKELVTLPYYGVFDNLGYQVDGSTVTLYGQVVRPVTRKDAENRIKRVAGVERVVNKIEVLPLSSFDDSIRYRTYRAVFNRGGLYRYAMGANPSVHIIVNNGHVTLEGVVANKADQQLAYIAANGVPGVFSVTNNLRTDRDVR